MGIGWTYWYRSLILVLRRQADLFEFKASLFYTESSKPARGLHSNMDPSVEVHTCYSSAQGAE